MTHPTWALGFEDEVWWSRLAQPEQHCWTDAEATQKLQELTPPAADPDPKALACYGLLVRPQPQQEEQMWLRFVTGRPVSAVTIAFLAWCCAQLAAQGHTNGFVADEPWGEPLGETDLGGQCEGPPARRLAECPWALV